MKRVWLAAALSLGCANLFGQGLQTVSYSAKQQTPPPPVLRASANLVVVDIVVRDKAGHAIQGLKQSDFALLEDKTAQKVNHFEEHTSAEIAASTTTMPKLPVGVFSNFAPVPAQGPLNVLLFDRFNMGPQLRLQLLKFIDAAKPGTRIAMLDLGERVRLLQGFTDDKELLRETLREKVSPTRATFGGSLKIPGVSELGQISVATEKGKSLDEQGDCVTQHGRSAVTVDALRFISTYLGNLPGRKNLLLFSAAYPLHMFPDQDINRECQLTAEDTRRAVSKLMDSQVSIYPIGLRGGVYAPTVPNEDMAELAQETGGRAYANANELDQITAQAIGDGSNYYTLTYAPQASNWDGTYRNIEVKLTDGRTDDLSYRRGYYANDPTKPVKTKIFGGDQAAKEARPDAMQMALMLGVPNASEVVFVTRVVSATGKTEDALATGNEGSKGLKGPYQRYTLRLAVDAQTLMLSKESDGVGHVSMEFVAMVYDQKGSVVNAVGRTMKADVPQGAIERELREGLPVELDVSVPTKGEYTLRVAVHDLNNDHVGAVEMPVSAAKNLASK